MLEVARTDRTWGYVRCLHWVPLSDAKSGVRRCRCSSHIEVGLGSSWMTLSHFVVVMELELEEVE